MPHRISFKFALEGIKYVLTSQPNFRFHLLAALTAFLASWLLKITRTEFIIILFTIGLVLVAEMLNTAVEAMTDLITLKRQPYAKIAKDVSAGMVLFTAAIALVTGAVVFTPYIVSLINNN